MEDDWRAYDKESMMEQQRRIGLTSEKSYVLMFERKYIQVFNCEKCGKLKRYVEDI